MLQLHNPRTTHERVITEDTGSIIGRNRKVSSRKKILNSVDSKILPTFSGDVLEYLPLRKCYFHYDLRLCPSI